MDPPPVNGRHAGITAAAAEPIPTVAVVHTASAAMAIELFRTMVLLPPVGLSVRVLPNGLEPPARTVHHESLNVVLE
jgi:hypothetical protein